MLDNFHFLRPLALLLIPIMLVLVWMWMRIKLASSQWQSILPAHLHQRLVTSKGDGQSKQPFIWLMLSLTLACIGIAGPTWEKLPQPVYQTNSGRVVVMDMSLSMRSNDITPSRLARAKFKAIDLIKEINDGEVGLVAYAGEAFTISPLTEDISNLENLIPSLSPEIMPSSGSNPVAGLEQAKDLLDNAGYQNGHIYWITDGIEMQDVKPVRDLVNDSQYEFSALIIGTDEGAPVQLVDGSLLKDNSGAIVIPRMNRDYFSQALSPSNARHTSMSIDDSDIRNMLLTSSRLDQMRESADKQSSGDAWRDMGAYLALLLLPIALVLFRKGLLFSVVFMTLLPLHSTKSVAQQQLPAPPSSSTTSANETTMIENLRALFLNQNQRGQQAFEKGDYDGASTLFNDINWQAASAYKAGDYERAADLYQQADGLDSIYNRGNALAKMGELEKAIDAYNKVLTLDPDHQEAASNKKILEDLLKQQQEQQQEQPSDEQNQQNGDQQQSQDDSNSNQDKQQNSEQSQGSDQQGQQSQSQGQEQANPQQDSEQDADQSPQDDSQGEQQDKQIQQGEQEQPANAGESTDESDLQQQQRVQAIDESDLTPEEREQMQRLQTLMNKVPDDPAFLLQRKMLIESQRRKQYAPPTKQEQEW